MATGPNIRVGDAEREAVAAQLRDHYADGRLTLDEMNERLDQTFAAKTYSELNAVTTDLPRSDGWTPAAGATAAGIAGTGSSRLAAGPQGAGSGPQDDAWQTPRGRAASLAAPVFAMIMIAGLWALVMFGGVFGGGGRPFGFVLLFGLFALIRRLFGGARRGGRCGRRW
jgi:Domain of unknown function (DUF1707)